MLDVGRTSRRTVVFGLRVGGSGGPHDKNDTWIGPVATEYPRRAYATHTRRAALALPAGRFFDNDVYSLCVFIILRSSMAVSAFEFDVAVHEQFLFYVLK